MTNEPDRPDVVLEPLVHVRDLAGTPAVVGSVLRATVQTGSRDGDWVRPAIGGARIGLLAHPPNPDQDQGTVELAGTSDTALQEQRAAVPSGLDVPSTVVDTRFRFQPIPRTPDGPPVGLNAVGAP